jgi:SRSO17 transposase
MKINTFWSLKYTIKTVKSKPEWEDKYMLKTHFWNKWRALYKSVSKKIGDQIHKKDLERYFPASIRKGAQFYSPKYMQIKS